MKDPRSLSARSSYSYSLPLTRDPGSLILTSYSKALQSMTSALAVRDIAERIRRPHEDMTTVVDRIRGWTDVGLIEAGGKKHPGTGKRRVYGEMAIVDAMLLTGLLDVGFGALRVEEFGRPRDNAILSLARDAARKMQSDARQIRYLVIFGRPPPEKMSVHSVYLWEEATGDPKKLIVEDAEWTIVLNLTVLFKGIRLGG
jgi:hypothetical protein